MGAPGWLKYACGKLIRLASLLAAVSIITFALISWSPIDPVQAYIGADMMKVGAEQREEIAAYWGLDQPPVERFLRWAGAIMQGDFGNSMIYREPVVEVIGQRFWYSLTLMAAAWLLSGLFGFAAGSAAAMNRGGRLDRSIQWVCHTLASTPSFWLGLLLLMVFAVWLGWLPAGLGVPAGVAAEHITIADRIRHMLLPAAALSITGISAVALHTRQKLINVLDSDYILYARAKGERGWQLYRNHGLRNIALPAMSLQLASISELFGGAVLAEQVFTYPGLGQATVQAGLRGDVPLLMGLVLFSTLFVFAGNTAADVLYRLVDPRMRGYEHDSRIV
ncbi:ABC transporter permease [Paenibacillus tarimensis]|uniref:ABC transporter permease n=1 Tax=Paenibacillus tarimensis TaxID=416012 RepID=UPI001F48155A|nr:ABC transporter permease [Paenibacillus tarimensis]MCF2944633.1 ABC transporter permease [Paenibacillus tarimensis]